MKKLISLSLLIASLTVSCSAGVSASTSTAKATTSQVKTKAKQGFNPRLQKISEKIKLGDKTIELNATLETAKGYQFTEDSMEMLRKYLVDAVKMVHKNHNIYPKVDDLHIVFEEPSKGCGAYFSPLNKKIGVTHMCCTLNEHSAILAHELTHKYINEQLGSMPNWLDEGFATQNDNTRNLFGHDIIGTISLNRYFSTKSRNADYVYQNCKNTNNYPSKDKMQEFYSYNQYLVKNWLKQNGNSLNGLILDLKNKVNNSSGLNNDIYFDYIMKTGGNKILGLSAKDTDNIKTKLFVQEGLQRLWWQVRDDIVRSAIGSVIDSVWNAIKSKCRDVLHRN